MRIATTGNGRHQWRMFALVLVACCHADAPAGPVLSVLPANARIRFAVIGDYGIAGPAEEAVARLVREWSPDFIITTGDNNYPRGGADTIDTNIGQYYAAFISPYKGRFGPGATRNRFFPSLGNHDTRSKHGKPYLEYFALPGNGRYYEFTAGPVSFYALDSVFDEPDGKTRDSRQARWLRGRLAAAQSCWRIAYFHHPPYASSGKEYPLMRWPFDMWGVDVVLSGHEHAYERLAVAGVTYFVVGLSGAEIDRFGTPSSASERRYNDDHGAMLVTVEGNMLTFQFFAADGTLVDQYQREKRCDAASAPASPRLEG